MGAFENRYLRIDNNNLSQEFEKQLLECYGIQYNEYGSINESLEREDLDNIYAIISIAFGDTSIYYEEKEGHTVTDWYAGYETLYNYKNSGKIETKTYDYCDGEGTANGLNGWDLIKEEIETKAKKQNIEVDWCYDDEDVYPNYANEEFSDFAESLMQKHGGLEGLSTKKTTRKIKKIIVNQDKVKKVIIIAKEKKYDELVRLLEKQLDNNGKYPDYIFEMEKEESKK